MGNEEYTLLLDIQRRLYEMELREMKREKWRKIRTVLVSLLVVLLLVMGVVVANDYRQLTESLDDVLEAVEQLDMDAIADTVNRLAKMDLSGLDRLLSYLAGKDQAELEKSVEDIRSAVENVAKLDMDALNESLDKLNKTLEPLLKLIGGKKNT